ncbi:MAG: hypothetical protein ACKOXB_10335 [Flavobacteriales bacterium]
MAQGNRMIVRSMITEVSKRKKSILVLQRYLRMKYKIFISSTVLERRMVLEVDSSMGTVA